MTNDIIQTVTNAVNVVTQTHTYTTPQSVAYNFKEWMGVVSMISTSLFAAFHVVFPKVQGFLDTRQGGWLQGAFYWAFGRPIAPLTPPPKDGTVNTSANNQTK